MALVSAVTPVLLAAVPGCGDTINNYNTTYNQYGAGGEGGDGTFTPVAGTAGTKPMGESGSPEVPSGGGEGGSGDVIAPEGGAGGATDDDGHDLYPDAPYANVEVGQQQLDIFGTVGTKFWFGVSQEQVELMNNDQGGGGFPGPFGDPYTPGQGGGEGPYADHLWITAPGKDGKTAHYGKVKVKVVGQSSRRPWTKTTIPNLNLDSNEYVDGQLIDGYEHLRLNNAQVGNIFREYLSLLLFRTLDYPAPYASYAMVSSNIWDKGVKVPMVLVERYKRHFCTRFEEWGGKCNNMWELYGADFGGGFGGPKGEVLGGFYDDPNNCQFDECESSRIRELDQLLTDTPDGDGFKAATADYIDWPAFHRFQCLEWALWVGDDALHNSNNIVIAEGADGKFRYLPYSTDISIGQDWWTNTPLTGSNRIARGCQADKTCWADTIATCEEVIADLTAADPLKMLADLHDMLAKEGMLRPGDEDRYNTQRKWFESRLVDLPVELETYRELPTGCPFEMVDCGGYCDYPWNCGPICKPPVGALAAAAGPPPEMMGVGGAMNVGGGVGVGGTMGVGGGAAVGGADPGPIGGDGPICPMITNYAIPAAGE